MKNRFLLILSFFCLVNILSAQKKMSRAQLVADADSLYARLYDIHPNMFAVYPKQDFEQEMERVKAQFADSMTVLDFYRNITPLISGLKDGHTNMYMPSYSLDWENQKVVFPLSVDINKKEYRVTIRENLSDLQPDLPIGGEILSINGKDIKSILNEFLRYVSGESNLFKFERIRSDFYLLCFMVYGEHTQFTVTYQSEDEKKTVTVEALSLNEYFSKQKERRKEKKEVWRNYSLDINKDTSTAIIDFRSFSDFDKFEAFLDSTFTLIKEQGIENLIVDIRRNGGGNSGLGDELFQYISPVPFVQYGRVDVKVSSTLKRLHSDITDTIGLKVYEGKLIELRKNHKRFFGNCYLLTSNNSFSSAVNFAWAFQYFKVGKVIGEETGGNIVCFGDLVDYGVPNTGIKFSSSYKQFYGYGADDSHRHGVIPDYAVPADEAMDYTIKLIREKQNK